MMEDFYALIRISAECENDAAELLQDYTGQETDLEIIKLENELSTLRACM